MSLLFYDKAIFKKIHSLYDECYFAAPEEAFKANAKAHEGKVMLPFIGIWRMPDFTINREMYNDSYVRRGPKANALRKVGPVGVEFPDTKVDMHGLPVTLTYQIDVYATKREVCDGLAAEIVIEMFEHPELKVKIESLGEFFMQFQIDVEDSISDNTSISDFEESNRFYRLSITILLNEAVIYRISKAKETFTQVAIDFSGLDLEGMNLDVT